MLVIVLREFCPIGNSQGRGEENWSRSFIDVSMIKGHIYCLDRLINHQVYRTRISEIGSQQARNGRMQVNENFRTNWYGVARSARKCEYR